MKMRLGTAVLAVACVALVIALVVIRSQMSGQQKKSTDVIFEFSNQLTTATTTLDDLRQVNLTLNNDLATNRQEAQALSNNLATTSVALQNAQDQLTNLNARVADLEAQNQTLDQRAADMTNTIATLNAQITETQMKLVTSETNNAFLESELKKQVADKMDLQHKFNDLAVVRTQVQKLRDDAITARRVEWIRQGIDPLTQMKGGQLLMQRTPRTNPPARPPRYDLNVEVGSDGSVKIIPALGATNSPAH